MLSRVTSDSVRFLLFACFTDFYFLTGILSFVVNVLIYNVLRGITFTETNENEFRIIKSMSSDMFKYTVFVEISIVVFLFVEALVDYVTGLNKGVLTKGGMVNFFVLCILLFSSLSIFLYVIPTYSYVLLNVFQNIRITLLITVTCTYTRFYGGAFWDTYILKAGTVIAVISLELKVIYVMIGSQHGFPEFMRAIGVIGQVITSLILIWHNFLWLYKLKFTLSKYKLTSEQKNCVVHVVLSIVVILACWIIEASIGFAAMIDMDALSVSANEGIFLFYCIIQAFQQNYLMRKETLNVKEELEFKRMFINYISHEVRTPLNTAIMGLQVLIEEMSRSISKNNYVDHIDTIHDIRTSCDIAINVLNELLTFDKLEGGTLMLEKSEVNLMRLIEEVVGTFQIQARKLDITLTAVVNPHRNDHISTTLCRVNKNKIAQVLRNLISNGLKFTPVGGAVTVYVDLMDQEGGENRRLLRSTPRHHRQSSSRAEELTVDRYSAVQMMRVSVVDTGAGISAENQKRLFKDVVQFNPGKLQQGGGSGLGLYISHGLTTLHRGTLTVYSKGEGYGSTFTLTLPTQLVSTRASQRDPSGRGDMATKKSSWLSSFRTNHFTLKRIHMIGAEIEPIVEDTAKQKKNIPDTSLILHEKVRGPEPKPGMLHPQSEQESPSRREMSHGRIHIDLRSSNGSVTSSHRIALPSQRSLREISAGSSHGKSSTEGVLYVKKGISLADETCLSPLSTNRMQSARFASTHMLDTSENKVDFDAHQIRVHDGLSNRKVVSPNTLDDSRPRELDSAIVSQGSNLRILVVEDSSLSRKMQCRLLKHRCQDCLEAENGKSAIEIISNSLMVDKNDNLSRSFVGSIDLVIMDSNMPVISGLEATKYIRSIGYKGIIIGVTGNVTAEDIQTFLNHGADAVLPKPLNIEGFDLIVKKLLVDKQRGPIYLK